MLIRIEISNENIDTDAVGVYENPQRWWLNDDATIETLAYKVLAKKYLHESKNFVKGYTLYINNKPVFYISRHFKKIKYYCDKNQLLSQFISGGSVIYSKFIIKTNWIYNVLKSISDRKMVTHKHELEKRKETYTKEFTEKDIENIYNKIIELYYTDNFFKHNLSEVVYAFSGVLTDKTQLNVEKCINDMLEELYKVIFERNQFNMLIQEKYSWLSKKNQILIHSALEHAAR